MSWCFHCVGLHPRHLQGLHLPSFKIRESLESATGTWVAYRKGELVSLKQGSGATPHCVWQTSGRSWQWSLLLGAGEIASYRGI